MTRSGRLGGGRIWAGRIAALAVALAMAPRAGWSADPVADPADGEGAVRNQAIKTPADLEGLPALNRTFWVRTPKTRQPPTLDGTLDLDKGEWSDAACLNGMVETRPTVLLPLACRTYVTWDDENLYLGVRTAIPEGGRLTRLMRTMDGEFGKDDSLELCFDPLNRDQSEPAFYRAIVNSLGYAMDDKIYVGVKSAFWDGGWKVKSDYKLGMDHWDVEVAVPVASMGLKDKNQSGQVWRFLVCRDWKRLLDEESGAKLWNVYSSLGTATGFYYNDGYGGLALDDAAPVVQLLDLSPLAQEKLGLAARLQNTTARPLECVVQVRSFIGAPPGDEKADWLTRPQAVAEDRKAFTLKPGEEGRYELAPRDLPPLPAEKDAKPGLMNKKAYHEMVFAVTSPDGKIVYHREQRRFAKGSWKCYLRPYAWPATVQYNPLKNNLKVWSDVLDDPNRAKARAVLAEVYNVGDTNYQGRALARVRADRPLRDIFETVQPLPPLPGNGEYPVKALLLGENDAVLDTAVGLKIEKLDEAKEFPWWKNKAGVLDQPVPPHKAMQYKDDVVLTTTGEHTFDASGLPAGMKILGERILSGPVRLLLKAGGRDVALRAVGKPGWGQRTPVAAELTGALDSDVMTIKVANRMEYDGFMRITLELEPKGAPEVERLAMEIPVAREQAAYLWGWAGDARSGLMEELKAGDGVVWDSRCLTMAYGQAVGSFFPQYALSGSLRGLCLSADNDRGWVPDNDVPAVEIVGRGPEVVLRCNFIGKPFKVSKARRLEFFLLGLPGRPLPEGWRIYRRTTQIFGSYVGNRNMNYIPPMPRDFAKAQAFMTQGQLFDKNDKLEERGVKAWGPNFEFTPWHDSHNMFHPPDPVSDKYLSYLALESDGSFTPAAVDFKCWWINEYVRQTDLAGIYFDTPDRLGGSRNTSSGAAYVIPEDQPGAGEIQIGYTVAGWREYMKRVRGIFFTHGRENPYLEMHATCGPIAVVTPFLDNRVDGEGYRMPSCRHFMAAWPLKQFRGIDVPPMFGIVTKWLNGYPWDGAIPNVDPLRCKQGALLLHDIFNGYGGAADWGQSPAAYSRQAAATRPPPLGTKIQDLHQKLLAHGLNRAEVEYLPYWKSQALLGVTGPGAVPRDGLYASAWRIPSQNKLIVGVVNYTEVPLAGVTVRPALEPLGLKPGAGERRLVADLESGEPLAEPVKLDLPPLDYALLVFATARESATGAMARVEIKKDGGARAGLSDAVIRTDLQIHGFYGDGLKSFAGEDAREVVKLEGDGAAHVTAEVLLLPAQDKALLVLRGGETGGGPVTVTVDLKPLGLYPAVSGHNLVIWDVRTADCLQETTHRNRGRIFFKGSDTEASLGKVKLPRVSKNDTVLLLLALQ